MDLDSLITSRDLNCTISLDEVCGHCRKINPLARKIQDVILLHNFVDICPEKIAPTWDNGHTSMTYVARRLDRFLIHE